MLRMIKEDELIFSGEVYDDRINTTVILHDYDWMTYIFKMQFKTKELGVLHIELKYYAGELSTMYVIQTIGNMSNEYIYQFDTKIFQKYYLEFMNQHIKAMMNLNGYAFYGGGILLNFYNEVVNVGILIDKKEEEIPKELNSFF